MKIEGASALVTGAGRGIGRAVALQLARAGARVLAVSRTESQLSSLVTEIQDSGGAAVAFPADLRQRRACDAAVAEAVERHGRLQILVNNAGVGGHAPLAETSDEEWARILDTNLTAVFQITRAALPHLTDGGGHVVMVSSLAGKNAIAGLSAYCASKAALDHMTACLMLEVRQQGVKVTTVAPGSVDTGFGDAVGMPGGDDRSWMLRADDIAAQILDLLRAREGAHSSRVEMRPSQPPKR
jgi:NAD(P)-dependent dehydrogenase (short-subunit alcohol dehydrogenase family)